MKARVKYDTKFGFQFTSATNIPRATAVLSTALREEVKLSKTCFICDNAIEEDEEFSDATLCSECLKNENTLDLYTMKFAKLMESV
jgi:predicted nucleic acid-binding Zn ribbon protein